MLRLTVVLVRFAFLIAVLAAVAISLPGWRAGDAAFPGANGKIAFHSSRDFVGSAYKVYVMNADGSGQTRLIANDGTQDLAAAWSPDGTEIAFGSNRDGNFEVYLMNADATNQTRLTNNAAADSQPAWSPDGAKIAFTTDRDGNTEVYVMNADGTGQTNFTSNPASEFEPVWSPDGTTVCFSSDRDGNQEVYCGPTNLTNNPASDGAPEWSPDGAKIAFHSNRDGNQEVYVMSADGTGQTNRTSNPASSDSYPVWSPDGTTIAFVSDRDANNEVYVMNADGSGPTRLTNNPAEDYPSDWQPLVDSDGDGIFDPNDACPQEPGPRERGGCPPSAVGGIAGLAPGPADAPASDDTAESDRFGPIAAAVAAVAVALVAGGWYVRRQHKRAREGWPRF